MKKTLCPISRREFRQHARPVAVTINGVPLPAAAKEFSTGSLGWNINGKLSVEVGGKVVECQVGLNLTVIGSKELPIESANGVAVAAAS
jgi:hypothetical protein